MMLKRAVFLAMVIVLISALTVSAELNKLKAKSILVGYEPNTEIGATGDEVEVFNEIIKNRKRNTCLVIHISSEHGMTNAGDADTAISIWEVLVDGSPARGPQFHQFSNLASSNNLSETYTGNFWICGLSKEKNMSIVVRVRPLDTSDTVSVGERTIEIFCEKCKQN